MAEILIYVCFQILFFPLRLMCFIEQDEKICTQCEKTKHLHFFAQYSNVGISRLLLLTAERD